jgi:hypothetical protein
VKKQRYIYKMRRKRGWKRHSLTHGHRRCCNFFFPKYFLSLYKKSFFLLEVAGSQVEYDFLPALMPPRTDFCAYKEKHRLIASHPYMNRKKRTPSERETEMYNRTHSKVKENISTTHPPRAAAPGCRGVEKVALLLQRERELKKSFRASLARVKG